jgi:hypothetical protein
VFSGVGNNPWKIGQPQLIIIKLIEQEVFHDEA